MEIEDIGDEEIAVVPIFSILALEPSHSHFVIIANISTTTIA